MSEGLGVAETLTCKPRQVSQFSGGILEVSDITAILGSWDDEIGDI